MASACSRMRETVLYDFGKIRRCSRMRTLVLNISEKVIDLL